MRARDRPGSPSCHGYLKSEAVEHWTWPQEPPNGFFFFFSLATPLNFLSNPRKVTQIPAHQLLVLLLRYCSIHENHQPQINSELGLFPPHLSYFVGQWSCQPSVLLPSRAAVRAANCTAVWPSSTQGPPGRTDWAEVRSSLHNMCCGHFPHLPFLLSSGKRGTKLPVLYLTYGYPLQPNSLQQVGKVWWCLGEKGQQTKMRTNTTGNQITIVMQKVRSVEMWKAFPRKIAERSLGVKRWFLILTGNSRINSSTENLWETGCNRYRLCPYHPRQTFSNVPADFQVPGSEPFWMRTRLLSVTA